MKWAAIEATAIAVIHVIEIGATAIEVTEIDTSSKRSHHGGQAWAQERLRMQAAEPHHPAERR